MRKFALSDDKTHVFIEGSDKAMGRVPLQMGTVVWCLEADSKETLATPSDVVVLSFAIPEGLETTCDMLIQIRQWTDSQTKPTWPEWHPSTAPLSQVVRLHQWIPLPNPQSPTSMCGEVVKGAIHNQIAAETKTTQSMEDRCKSISLHGEDDNFTHSLDYYVTMRPEMISPPLDHF